MTRNKSLNQVKVGLDFGAGVTPVGRLASRDHTLYFEFQDDFLRNGLNLSPLRLPVEPGLKTFDPNPFQGLPGVFDDSLPDGWGRLVLDRYLRSQQIMPEEFSPLDRLACVGTTGLGALVYEPDQSEEVMEEELNLDVLAAHAREVLQGDAEDVLQELINLNGSSAGARPKALIGVDETLQHVVHGKHTLPGDHSHWMVKFANGTDGKDAGAVEYVYSLMACEAGLEMAETHLFPAVKSAGFFATKRFDREGRKRLHMHTASGLLHSNFRTPSLDYEDLLTLTEFLTRDVREVEMMFRLAVFNVLAHNRDDHGKNFSFLMDAKGEWRLSPAYDLTFSSGPRGHQSTMVMGEGQKPGIKDLKSLGKVANLKGATVNEIIEQVRDALSRWEVLAREHDISRATMRLVGSRIAL